MNEVPCTMRKGFNLVGPSMIEAARRKLSENHGINLQQRGLAAVARACAAAMHTEQPVGSTAQSGIIRRFLRIDEGALADYREAPPFRELVLSEAMKRQLARCQAYRDIAPSSDGRMPPRIRVTASIILPDGAGGVKMEGAR